MKITIPSEHEETRGIPFMPEEFQAILGLLVWPAGRDAGDGAVTVNQAKDG